MNMYLILEPKYDGYLSISGPGINSNFKKYVPNFTLDLSEVSESLENPHALVFKVGSLERVTSVDVTYTEKLEKA